MMRLRDEVRVIVLNIEVAESDEVNVTSCIIGGCDESGALEKTLAPSPYS